MKNIVQLSNIYNCSKKNIFIFILFCTCSLSLYAQKMKNHLYKELTAKVGAICEETPDDNPCAGSEIYMMLVFDEKQVSISEKEISSCDQESVHNIGIYNWKLLENQKISIDDIAEQTKGTYAENIVLELRDKQLVGNITHVNGRVIEYIFKEKKQE